MSLQVTKIVDMLFTDIGSIYTCKFLNIVENTFKVIENKIHFHNAVT